MVVFCQWHLSVLSPLKLRCKSHRHYTTLFYFSYSFVVVLNSPSVLLVMSPINRTRSSSYLRLWVPALNIYIYIFTTIYTWTHSCRSRSIIRYRALFEIANSAHTFFDGTSHSIDTTPDVQFLSWLPTPASVFSVNKSKFDSRINAAAYMHMPSSKDIPQVENQI